MSDNFDLLLRAITTYAPLQIEGTVNGLPLFFYARRGEWEFTVASTPSGTVTGDGVLFHRVGEGGETLDDAEAIIRRCAAEFVGGAL
jgi:hypothetical protein